MLINYTAARARLRIFTSVESSLLMRLPQRNHCCDLLWWFGEAPLLVSSLPVPFDPASVPGFAARSARGWRHSGIVAGKRV